MLPTGRVAARSIISVYLIPERISGLKLLYEQWKKTVANHCKFIVKIICQKLGGKYFRIK